MLKPQSVLAAALLATVSMASHADTFFATLDLSAGNTSYGRNNAVGSFTDTFSFVLAGSSFAVTSTASTAQSDAQNLDFTSLVIENSSNAVVATFLGNLGTPSNEFYSLPETVLGAGSYRLIVTGVNSPTQASYSGNIAVSPVPESGTLAMMLAGLGAMAFVASRRERG
jgi:hypothetical protein